MLNLLRLNLLGATGTLSDVSNYLIFIVFDSVLQLCVPGHKANTIAITKYFIFLVVRLLFVFLYHCNIVFMYQLLRPHRAFRIVSKGGYQSHQLFLSQLVWPVDRVRSTFIDYFEKKHEHTHYRSSPGTQYSSIFIPVLLVISPTTQFGINQ